MLLKIKNGFPRLFRRISSEYSDIKELAANVVKDFLSGQWKSANPNNVTVIKLNGGLSNCLYQIKMIPFNNENDTFDPNVVLLRIHGPNYGKYCVQQMMNESLVFMLMSERRLGPKLYGVFPGGRIEEYIHARSLNTNELNDPKISLAIASKMAELHSINVPISKNPDYIFDLMIKWLITLQDKSKKFKKKNMKDQKLIDKFLSFDLKLEIRWLREHLKKFNSKVVFCHNDLQEGNILIKHDSVNSDEPRLIFIDYEYSSYNYRAFELANHFLEYTISYKVTEPPYYAINVSSYPSAEQQVKFVRKYLNIYNASVEATNLKVPDGYSVTEKHSHFENIKVTTEEFDLLVEISNFRLLSHLLWGIWSAIHSESNIEFGYWDYCISRLKAYYKTKNEIISPKLLKDTEQF